MNFSQNSDIVLIGVDGGASKVSCLAVERTSDEIFKPVGEPVSIEYSESENFNPKFKPVDLQTQLNELSNETFNLTPDEKEQGSAILVTIANCLYNISNKYPGKKLLIGIGFPGLKTQDGTGIGAIANGPRMPEFGKILEGFLSEKGVQIVGPLGKLGSDADYCGIGENYAESGSFRNIENGYYLGGGTGVADALKLNGHLVTFDSAKDWIAKTWEFRSTENLSMERYISAGGIQFLYSRESGIDTEELSKNGIFSNEIFNLAIDGDSAADKTIKRVLNSLATIFHERISTIFSGYNGNLHFMNEKRALLLGSHSYMGTLLDRIVIGQRLSNFIILVRNDKKYWNSFLSDLGEKLSNSSDPLPQHYLRNGIFKDELIICSELREAPAIGAAISKVI